MTRCKHDKDTAFACSACMWEANLAAAAKNELRHQVAFAERQHAAFLARAQLNTAMGRLDVAQRFIVHAEETNDFIDTARRQLEPGTRDAGLKPGDLVATDPTWLKTVVAKHVAVGQHGIMLYAPHDLACYTVMTGVGLLLICNAYQAYVVYDGRVWVTEWPDELTVVQKA